MRRFAGFDGLRALAVTAVFLEHRSLLGGHGLGHAGVLTFFALSGFLIVGILHEDRRRIEAGQEVWASLFEFFRRRTFRIFPIYYVTLAAIALSAAAGFAVAGWRWEMLPWLGGYGANIYQGYVAKAWAGAVTPFWSLAVEEQFYLIAAPLLLFTPARRHHLVCIAIILAGVACAGLLHATQASMITIYNDSLIAFAGIAVGGLVRLFGEGRAVRRPGLLAVAAFALAALSMALADIVPAQFTVPAFAALLIWAITLAQGSRWVAWLEFRPLAALGKVSYGLYLFHNLFWLELPWESHLAEAGTFVVNFAATVALALLSWRLIERPILDWSRRGQRSACRPVPERTATTVDASRPAQHGTPARPLWDAGAA